MRAALRKVLETTEQISQIAYDAGYQHPSQFDSHFEMMFGASPTELRQLFRSEPLVPRVELRGGSSR